MLAILLVLFFLWLLSLWSPTCWLWQRDNDEENGGGDDRTSGQHRRRTYVGYTTCVLFFCSCYLFVVSRMLANGGRTATRRIGGNDDGTRGQHHRRKYVGYLLFGHLLVFTSINCDGQCSMYMYNREERG